MIICLACQSNLKHLKAKNPFINPQTKINFLQQQIQTYQANHPQRNQQQKYELSCLWLELVYWQLVAEGEIKPDPLFFKAQEFWENLKKTYQRKEEWPYSELKDFLTKQPKEYTEYLISFIQQEDKKECLKLEKWLSERLKNLRR